MTVVAAAEVGGQPVALEAAPDRAPDGTPGRSSESVSSSTPRNGLARPWRPPKKKNGYGWPREKLREAQRSPAFEKQEGDALLISSAADALHFSPAPLECPVKPLSRPPETGNMSTKEHQYFRDIGREDGLTDPAFNKFVKEQVAKKRKYEEEQRRQEKKREEKQRQREQEDKEQRRQQEAEQRTEE
ncbi:uncharacterized protein [Macrobrachium rosenbergii]|uniref:uncharacterized protein n=1 Tax=Macrobrachium rosenbergii TaxID=79674 RepID=UPI0034D606DC